jgi:hypothetical protein
VKCDETKPECLRCQKFGRTCDGYAEPPPPGQEPSRPRRRYAVVPIQPRIAPAALSGPTISIHRTDEESRYFDVFVELSARELAGYFTTDFWGRIVSQESHAITPIRYAAIAIGALNRSLENAPESDQKVNIIQNVDKKHHEYAVIYFLKAVQSLNEYLSTSNSPQTRVALISCLLFVCFETFQGSFISTCRQYYGGLTILRSYCARHVRPSLRGGQQAPQQQNYFEGNSRQLLPTPQIMTTLQIEQRETKPPRSDDVIMHAQGAEGTPGTTNNQSLDWTDVVMPQKAAAPVAGEIGPFIWSPYGNKTAVADTEMVAEQQQTSAAPSVPYAPSTSGSQSAHIIAPNPRNPSSISSGSRMSTPASIAPAESGTPPGSTPPSQAASRMQTLDLPSPTPPILNNDYSLEDSFVQMFTRLDGTGEYFGMPPLIPPMMWDKHKIYHRPVPDSFPDFHSAQRSWDFVMDEALQFYRRTFFNKVFAPANCDPPAKIAKKYAYHVQNLAAFERAFQPILDRSIDSDGTITNPAAVVLTLYQKCTLIILAAVQDPSEMIYDSYLPDFQYVTRTCARLVASQDGKTLPKVPRFSFEVGIVPPLHCTVMKCRDPIIRREAINILFSSKRQEGMWDGILCSRIGSWLVACEEEGLPPPPLETAESNLYVSPLESEIAERPLFDHSKPQPAGDRAEPPGGWEDGKMLSDVITQVIGGHFGDDSPIEADTAPMMPSADAIETLKRRRPVFLKEWRVPEKNRVQITVLSFHIPERYIKFKCRKSLPGEDGTRDEREIILTW